MADLTDVIRQIESDAAVEHRRAHEDGVYWTSVGLRVAMWRWGGTLYREAPIVGHGPGSYRIGVSGLDDYRRAAARKPGQAEWMLRDHCH